MNFVAALMFVFLMLSYCCYHQCLPVFIPNTSSHFFLHDTLYLYLVLEPKFSHNFVCWTRTSEVRTQASAVHRHVEPNRVWRSGVNPAGSWLWIPSLTDDAPSATGSAAEPRCGPPWTTQMNVCVVWGSMNAQQNSSYVFVLYVNANVRTITESPACHPESTCWDTQPTCPGPSEHPSVCSPVIHRANAKSHRGHRCVRIKVAENYGSSNATCKSVEEI